MSTEPSPCVAILNNWGYDKQNAGQIKPFEWKITFTVKGLE